MAVNGVVKNKIEPLADQQGGWINYHAFLLAALLVGNGLLLAPEGTLVRAVGAILLLLLPGLVWAELLSQRLEQLGRVAIGCGLSYAFVVIVGLILHFVPGPISFWSVFFVINGATSAALATVIASSWTAPPRFLGDGNSARTVGLLLLAVVLIVGAFFRFTNLGYSELDGDEAKVMIPAAEVIEGWEYALFYQRKKGPAEILLPMMVWRLNGLVNELSARLPFALAGLLTILTTYLVGRNLSGEKVGLISAAFIALNGLLVAFSRIVQYQQLVIWLSLLSFLCVCYWRRDRWWGWWAMAGLFLGVGVLAHYDAILVAPALVYLALVTGRSARPVFRAAAAAGASFMLVICLFLIPYFLTPQITDTAEYLGERIGSELVKNQLDLFFQVNFFYGSSYYLLIVGGLALAFLSGAIIQLNWGSRTVSRYLVPIVLILMILGLSFWPGILTVLQLDLAFVPFSILFLAAFLSPGTTTGQRAIILWLATTFLGYNFMVASPRTHFYTIVPPLVFLAGLTADRLWDYLSLRGGQLLPASLSLLLALLFGGYLYQAYLRPDVHFEVDWPESHPPIYWYPYDKGPSLDNYGFMHKDGWKTVGGLYATGALDGNYRTNGRHATADWYTRNQLRDAACPFQSKYFFGMRRMVINPSEFQDYNRIAKIELEHHKGIDIHQLQSTPDVLEPIVIEQLNSYFDQTTRPAAFVRSIGESYSANVNLADAIRLKSYDLKIPERQPGSNIVVTLQWEAQQNIPLDLDVFVHLEDRLNSENIWSQSNGTPACGKYPTSNWQPGQIIDDRHLLPIPVGIPSGTYRVTAGMYVPQDNLRVPIMDKKGQPTARSLTLAKIDIE